MARKKIAPAIIVHTSEPDPWLPNALMRACEQADSDLVAQLIPNHDINARNDIGYTALMIASGSITGSAAAIRALVGAGADLHVCDDTGVDALMLAAELGNVDRIEALLEVGANPRALDCGGAGALERVIGGGNGSRAIDLLVDRMDARDLPRLRKALAKARHVEATVAHLLPSFRAATGQPGLTFPSVALPIERRLAEIEREALEKATLPPGPVGRSRKTHRL